MYSDSGLLTENKVHSKTQSFSCGYCFVLAPGSPCEPTLELCAMTGEGLWSWSGLLVAVWLDLVGVKLQRAFLEELKTSFTYFS